MLFNSLDFAIFLPIVFLLYWFVTNKNLKLQNLLVVGASYLFYGWWDWRFLSLIAFSTLVDFTIGLKLKDEKNNTKRKALLWTSVIINLGFLGFFKYFNFFIDNFIDAFSLMGYAIKPTTLNIILPVGISFYTFQTLSYTIDVYKKKLEPTNDLIAFTAFVSFFPQLVAGPIERATNLLPQFYKKREFDYAEAVNGLRQILWGFAKKIIIADNCAEVANAIFNSSADLSGSTLLLGSFFFSFQIYGDFSGYSDIAIGTSRLFGFNLMQNFAFPFFSRDISEFWRRWHISLSTWFRDYLYIPLGGSKGGIWPKIRNFFIIFIVSGFWHGANWTYILWGALNAFYILPVLLLNKNRHHVEIVAKGKILPSILDYLKMAGTFLLHVIAWFFFRADNINTTFTYLTTVFNPFKFGKVQIWEPEYAWYIVMIFIFNTIEWFGREDQYAIEKLWLNWKRPYRWAIYLILAYAVMHFAGKPQEFIYFQF